MTFGQVCYPLLYAVTNVMVNNVGEKITCVAGGRPSDIEDDYIEGAWLVFYSCLSALGIVFAVFCFIYNLGCRNKP